jgi:Fic family protein
LKSYYDNKVIEYTRAMYKFVKENISPEQLTDIQKFLFARYVHGSNSIEGNTLSKSDVYDYLHKNKSSYGKSHNELLQTRNHINVKTYLDRYDGDINQKLIKTIHNKMLLGVDGYDGNDKPGVYRQNIAQIKHDNSMPSKPENIEEDIDKIQDYYHSDNENVHHIECIAIFHHEFERIHPFRDGNGRTGRAILDYMFKVNDFPPIYIPTDKHENYFNALDEGSYIANYAPLNEFIIERMFATHIHIMANSPIKNLIKSDGYRDWFSPIFGREIYDITVKYIEYYANTDNDP